MPVERLEQYICVATATDCSGQRLRARDEGAKLSEQSEDINDNTSDPG